MSATSSSPRCSKPVLPTGTARPPRPDAPMSGNPPGGALAASGEPRPAHRMVVMTTEENGLTAVSGWTDDEIRADNVRAAGVLYAAAAYEELKLIELAEHHNELNQQKLLNIGAGEASNLLHVFWDKGYKRMPAKRRLAVLARVVGAPGAADDAEVNDDFAGLLEDLASAIAGSPDAVGAAASALQENLSEHTDEATTKAAVVLRDMIAELGLVLSDLELRTVFRTAECHRQLA